MSGVYVIKLNSNKYYVGKSNNIKNRIDQHKSFNKCAEFVKINGGVKSQIPTLTPYEENHNDWEKRETIVRMLKHGYNNVRGWEYTNCTDLTIFDYHAIRKEIIGSTDRCRKCGGIGHMANKCSNQPEKWFK